MLNAVMPKTRTTLTIDEDVLRAVRAPNCMPGDLLSAPA
jgi:hypothetical protein